MSKKDYEAIAKSIKEEIATSKSQRNPAGSYSAIERLATGWCNIFKAGNPNFDRKRFMVACGYPSGEDIPEGRN